MFWRWDSSIGRRIEKKTQASKALSLKASKKTIELLKNQQFLFFFGKRYTMFEEEIKVYVKEVTKEVTPQALSLKSLCRTFQSNLLAPYGETRRNSPDISTGLRLPHGSHSSRSRYVCFSLYVRPSLCLRPPALPSGAPDIRSWYVALLSALIAVAPCRRCRTR